jgi:opacity protein-like surface antigen
MMLGTTAFVFLSQAMSLEQDATVDDSPAFSIELGASYWRAFPRGDMVITRGSEPGSGTAIHLGEDLDLKPAHLWQVATTATYGNHRVTLRYQDLDLIGRETLDHPFIFHGVTYPAGDSIRADIGMPSFSLGYDYRIVDEGTWDLRVGVVGILYNFSARIRDDASGLDEDRAYRRAAPALTTSLQAGVAEWHGRLEGRIGYLDSDRRAFGGFQCIGGLQLWGRVDLDLGYRWERFDASAETNKIALTAHGPIIELGVRF